jgi:hypothetical protein
MRATVRRWVNNRVEEVEAALTTNSLGLVPMSLETLERTAPELAHALSGVRSYVAKEDLMERWPFPASGSNLALVLHQWVQEVPNQTLANQMSSNEEWLEAMSMFAQRLNRPARDAVIYAEDHAPRPITIGSRSIRETITMMGAGAAVGLIDDIRSVLAHCLLPVTPATLGYSITRIVGDDNIKYLPWRLLSLVLRRKRDGRPLPARGVLVETHLFASLSPLMDDEPETGGHEYAWVIQPDAQFHLSADIALVKGPFIRGALAKAMLAHRAFVESLAQHPVADIHAIRKAQAGTFQRLPHEHDRNDYIAEALHEARGRRAMLLSLSNGLKQDAEINRLLIRVQKRVGQRRQRAGLSTAPPKGWRQAARKLIEQDLKG